MAGSRGLLGRWDFQGQQGWVQCTEAMLVGRGKVLGSGSVCRAAMQGVLPGCAAWSGRVAGAAGQGLLAMHNLWSFSHEGARPAARGASCWELGDRLHSGTAFSPWRLLLCCDSECQLAAWISTAMVWGLRR